KELRAAIRFVQRNLTLFLKYYDQEITVATLMRKLRKIDVEEGDSDPSKYKYAPFGHSPYITRETRVRRTIIVMGDNMYRYNTPVLRVKLDRDTSKYLLTPAKFATVTIEDEPRVVQGQLSDFDYDQVKKFIVLNKQLLLDYWN